MRDPRRGESRAFYFMDERAERYKAPAVGVMISSETVAFSGSRIAASKALAMLSGVIMRARGASAQN